MRMVDLRRSVTEALEGLGNEAYLVAMAAIVDEVSERYRYLMPEHAQRLTARTVDLIRAASANVEGLDRAEAAKLYQEWIRTVEEADEPHSPFVHPGAALLWSALGSLTGELLGDMPQHSSSELVVRAVAMGPGSIYDQGDDEFIRLYGLLADENNDTVKLLHKLQAVADLLAAEGDHRRSPHEVKAIVFGR